MNPAENNATRPGSTRPLAKGHPHALLVRMVGALALLGCLSLLFASPAAATQTHLFKEDFGPVAQPTFVGWPAAAMATIQSSGDLLIANGSSEAGLISRFKPNGEPDLFSALGSSTIDGAKGPGGKPCAEEPASCDGTPLNALKEVGSSQLAIDESAGLTAGDIYLLEGATNQISIFAADGSYLGKLNRCGTEKFTQAAGIAVDSNGNLYVSDTSKNVIHKFVPTANPPVITDCSATTDIKAAERPGPIAMGRGSTAGYLFVVRRLGGVNGGGLLKLNLSNGELAYSILEGLTSEPTGRSNQLRNLAVDTTTGHVFVGQEGELEGRAAHVDEYDASGASSAKLVSSTAVGLVNGAGLAFAKANGDIYLSNQGQHISTYDSAIVTQPAVTTKAVTAIRPSKVTLNGTVDPDGEELTECAFEYGFAGHNSTVPCTESLADIGSGHGAFAVHAPVAGLKPHEPYEYRLIAQNSNHVDVLGSRIPFRTTPVAVTTSASSITGLGATLSGTVNPDGSAVTECQFEYLPSSELADEVQTITVTGATGGTFTLSFEGEETSALPDDVTRVALSQALTALPKVEAAGGISVLGTDGGPFELVFNKGAVNFPQLGADGSSLTPAGAAIGVTTQSEGKGFFDGEVAPCIESPGEIGEGEDPKPVHASVSGLQKGITYSFRLTAANGTDGVEHSDAAAFTTLLEANVETKPASAIGGAVARLNGTVKPGGEPVTECSFAYVAASEYDAAASDPYAHGGTVPCAESEAEIGTGPSAVPVHADVVGLNPATSYHFHLVANPNGVHLDGGDAAFFAAGALIEAQWAASVGSGEATLAAAINPKDSPTTYHLQYGKEGRPFEVVTAESESIGGGNAAATVEVALEGLSQGTGYHYRFVASSHCNALEPAEVCVTVGRESSFVTAATQPEVPQSCSNEGFRGGASASLPDCRAYEMVSPIDKNGGDVGTGTISFSQAGEAGTRLTFSAIKPFAGAEAGPFESQYLATRVDGVAWQTQAVNPPRNNISLYPLGGINFQYRAFSPDLCSGWFVQDNTQPLVPGAPTDTPNLYRRDFCAGSYELMTSTVPPTFQFDPLDSYFYPEPQGASADGTRTVFRVNDALTPDAAPEIKGNESYQLYLSQPGGSLRLISVLPSNSSAPGQATNHQASVGTAGAGYPASSNSDNLLGAVSSNASRVFWSESPVGSSAGNARDGGPGPIYLRVNATEPESAHDNTGKCTEAAKACTYPVSGLVPPESGVQFWQGDGNGTRAIFSVAEKLYEFEAREASDGLETEAHLIAEGFQGFVGASTDVNRVYFVSAKALAGEGVAGKSNLYLYERGSGLRFVGPLSSVDALGFNGNTNSPTSPASIFPYKRTARVNPDGTRVAFTSTASATGYDSTASNSSGQAASEVYIYDATANGGAGTLTCASCNPSGVRPVARKVGEASNGALQLWAAAQIPGWKAQSWPTRALSNNGRRLFFNAYDALLPSDTNGAEDVYEWEAPGEGSCSEASAAFFQKNGGCLYLISSGKSPKDSEFFDATPEGKDVFFSTLSSLLPQDKGLTDVYDARFQGGLPEPSPQAPACEGEACQGPAAPPNDATPASSSFQGAGNLREATKQHKSCAKKKVMRKGRCVARKPKARKHKASSRHAAKKRANRKQEVAR